MKPAFDMSAAEHDDFKSQLWSATSVPMPPTVLPSGSRIEYDRQLGTTVEICRDGTHYALRLGETGLVRATEIILARPNGVSSEPVRTASSEHSFDWTLVLLCFWAVLAAVSGIAGLASLPALNRAADVRVFELLHYSVLFVLLFRLSRESSGSDSKRRK